MKIRFLLVGPIIFSGIVLGATARAVCPVCVVAVGAGLGLSRWLGVDDVVSSLWIGGVLVALSIWTIIWLRKKNWNFKHMTLTVALGYYGLTIIPLYYYGIIGHPENTILGIDKIIFGTAMGSAFFLLSSALSNYLKAKNGGRVYFPYQKVVLPFLSLIAVSLIFYFII